MKNVGFFFCKCKGVGHVWFYQWKEERVDHLGPLNWEKFKIELLDRLFPIKMREAKVLAFINFHQGNMSLGKG